MNRAMFSGVSGLKTHQTKMDVIGNNIANVNTYGYKSQRAVFSDIYYQSLKDAAAGTTTRGGINPSSVGYGSSLVGVQTQMKQSSMQNTGFGMDVAITGEGFLQVMDSEGNVFYTKAGLLDYDSNGYLTDINGNFVLGAAGSDTAPGSRKIKLDNIGNVEARTPAVTQSINGIDYTISATNATKYGNVSLSIGSTEELPAGQKATATISSTGAISVKLNAYEKFSSMKELNDVINAAIKEGNGGKDHPAGTFTIESKVNGIEVNKFGVDAKNATWAGTAQANFLGGAKITDISADFAQKGDVSFTYSLAAPSGDLTVTATIGGKAYSGTVTSAGGSVVLETGDAADGSITMSVPSQADMMATYGVSTLADLDTALNGSLTSHNYNLIAAVQAQSVPLTGAEIASENYSNILGSVKGMEDGAFGGILKFMKTSNDFKGEGTITSSDFDATYKDDGVNKPSWAISMVVNGVSYSAEISEETKASSLLLKSKDGDYMQVSNPGFEKMNEYYQSINSNQSPVDGSKAPALTGTTTLTVSPSTSSKTLGLSADAFALTGGTEGGAVTLDELSSIAIGSDGVVSVSHAEKGTVVAGKISLASFANPSGLKLEGNNYYSATANSGVATLSDPGSDGTGGLKSSALEMSNVDLSSEFAEMITTQRGFQANSRIITVSDTMLEELINLKR